MRSFRGGGGMGGGGRAGGGMLRTVRKVVRAGVNGLQHDSFSSNQSNSSTRPTTTTRKPDTSNRGLSLSSTITPSTSSSSPRSHSRAATTRGINSCPFSTDEFEWECVDEVDSERTSGFSDDCVFGSPPSIYEVEDAILSLQQVMHPVYVGDRMPTNLDSNVTEQIMNPDGVQRALLTNSDVDWNEPSIQLYDWSMLQHNGSNRVCDAFHLLETEPSIQRMVVSLSSDKAVWDAVLNNEVVRELRESFDKAEKNCEESSDKGLDNNHSSTAAGALRWIFENMKSKFTEAIANVTKLVTELFQRPDHMKKENNDAFMEKLKASFMLTVAVLLIVVVTRAHRT
ncbi:hypothetical protein Ancab_008778 [Ancistrocladus abbreviatus]